MDYTLDPEDQIYDESTGETWRDHLLDVAIQTLTQQAAIANEAQASGYTMSAQAQESLQNTPGLHSGRHHHLRLRQQGRLCPRQLRPHHEL